MLTAPRTQKVTVTLLIAIAYFLAGKAGLAVAFVNSSVSAVWAASGVALEVLLILGNRMWVGIFVGAFFVNVTATGSAATSLGIAAGNTLAAIIGATFARRFAGFPQTFHRAYRVFRFVLLACIGASIVAATVGTTSLVAGGFVGETEFLPVWLTWWLGDAAGAILVAPLVLLWTIPRRREPSRGQRVELALLLCSVGIVGWLAFFATIYPIGFLCLAVCAWAAFRFGPREAATVACALSGIAVWGTLSGRGAFAPYSYVESLWLLQAFMAFCAVIGLVLAAAVSERTIAQERVEHLNRHLEARVRERTHALTAALDRVTLSENRLAEAQYVAQIGSWEWVIADDSESWSAELYRICGFEPNSIHPHFDTFIQLLHPDDRPVVTDTVRRALQDHQPFAFEMRIVRPDKQVRTLEARGRVIVDDVGHVVRMVGTAQDISERKRLEDELRQAQKLEAVGRLAGGVAHDFNNLLTAISGYAELVLTQVGKGAPIAHDVQEIRKAAHAAATLTRQLLAFSRRQPVRLLPVDLSAVIANVEPMLRRTLGEDVGIEIRVGDGLPCVKADPVQLQQVLINLAVNARDAMSTGGTLTIETAHVTGVEHAGSLGPSNEQQRYVRLVVRDTGCGMDAETKARIFEPFFTTKDDGIGTGLGLATVYAIVQHLTGHIEVESVVGHGTTFTLWFPATTETAEVLDAGSLRLVENHVGTETVLLAEDDPAVRVFAARVLRQHGYEVHAASTAADAVAFWRGSQRPFDLLLTDVVLPDMTGVSLVARLRTEQKQTRVLYMSGYSKDAVARQGVCERQQLLEKPFTASELLERVRTVLDDTRSGTPAAVPCAPPR
jgi:PAS domain S-box-containing protein